METSPGEQLLLQLLPLTIMVAFVAFSLWTTIRILRKAGYSGWWSLLTILPLANIIVIWVFAFADWPALRARN